MLTTVDFIVNSFYIRSGLKPHIIDSPHRTPSFDNLSNKPILINNTLYMDQALTLPTGISWPSVTIKYNYCIPLFLPLCFGSKVYNNNIYNYAQ